MTDPMRVHKQPPLIVNPDYAFTGVAVWQDTPWAFRFPISNMTAAFLKAAEPRRIGSNNDFVEIVLDKPEALASRIADPALSKAVLQTRALLIGADLGHTEQGKCFASNGKALRGMGLL